MASKPKRKEAPWYAGGLGFSCTECGKCCEIDDGYVWVSPLEAQALADYLKLSLDAFGRAFLRKVGARYALLDRPGDRGCVFLHDNRCSVYVARPAQCRSFPFWSDHLETPQAWASAAESCEGISEDAARVPFEEIERRRG